MLKGLLRIRRYQQETPCALQEADVRSWLRFGEAYSALRDWRPIPAALLSHSVVQCSGTEEFLPTTTATHLRSPPSGRNYPDKQRSIRKKTCSVKLSSKRVVGQFEFGVLRALWHDAIMPKKKSKKNPPKGKPKPQKDVNQIAYQVVREATKQ